jgi:hypothetical protein
MTNRLADTNLARIADLHPTQITVGFREVSHKRDRWRSRIPPVSELDAPGLVAPIVSGPGGVAYLIDRHHLACALRDEGVQSLRVRQIADFGTLSPGDFWPALEARGWCRPYDDEGRRRRFQEIPDTLEGLIDDPFRSLASALRRAGGFAKSAAPFSEFAWADFLRRHITSDAVAADFDGSLERALILVRTPAARGVRAGRRLAVAAFRAAATVSPFAGLSGRDGEMPRSDSAAPASNPVSRREPKTVGKLSLGPL